MTPRRSKLRTDWLWVLAAALCAVSCDPGPTDTGFTGTWERTVEGGYSVLAIRQVGDDYGIRWSKLAGNQIVRCDDQGLCEESVEGQKVYEWRFRALRRPGSGDLFVEVQGSPVGDGPEPLRYTDRLELQPGGLELWSYQIEQNGLELDPPAGPVKFHKSSDKPL